MKKYDSEARKAEYRWYKERGICTRCHHEKAVKGQTLCPDCKDVRREENRKRYHEKKDQIREYSKQYFQTVYQQRKADGVCVRCGKRPPKEGLLSCTRCLVKQAEYKERSFRRKGGTPRWLAMDLGLCAVCCKNPVMKDKKVCAGCYDHICQAARITGRMISERRKAQRQEATA